MNRTPSRSPTDESSPLYAPHLYRSLQRRDWELWSIALLLMTVFAGGVIVFFYQDTTLQQMLSPTVARYLWLVFFGLITLIVLLNIYLIARKRALADLWERYLLQQQELESERERGMLDPLTRIYNRRFFDETVPKELHRSDRTDRPLSFLLVDVDDFKRINQEKGHFMGDELLREVAGLVQGCLRASDYAFRFGGDEFLAVLPDTPPEGVAVVIRRIRERMGVRTDLAERAGRPVTLTFGQATYTKGGSLDETIMEAERALYATRTMISRS